MHISSFSFVYLCFFLSLYDACWKSSVLRVGVKTLHNTIQCNSDAHEGDDLFPTHLSSSCVWAAVQTKLTRSSNHIVFLMIGDRRSSRRFGGRRTLPSKIRWLVNCSSAPQLQLGISNKPQGYRHVPRRRTPVLSLFSATRSVRLISEPGGGQTAGVSENWAGGLALSHAALPDSRRLKLELISAAAWRWKRRRECRHYVSRNCAAWTRVWRGWLVFSCAWSTSLKVKCFPRAESTGKSSSRVGLRLPKIMRNVSFNATSSFLVLLLRYQGGAAYSAALLTKASDEVRGTEAWSPHVEPARRR